MKRTLSGKETNSYFSDPGVARGRLIGILEADANKLTLGGYTRRSGLQVLEFYALRIDETRERLRRLVRKLQNSTGRQSDSTERFAEPIGAHTDNCFGRPGSPTSIERL